MQDNQLKLIYKTKKKLTFKEFGQSLEALQEIVYCYNKNIELQVEKIEEGSIEVYAWIHANQQYLLPIGKSIIGWIQSMFSNEQSIEINQKVRVKGGINPLLVEKAIGSLLRNDKIDALEGYAGDNQRIANINKQNYIYKEGLPQDITEEAGEALRINCEITEYNHNTRRGKLKMEKLYNFQIDIIDFQGFHVPSNVSLTAIPFYIINEFNEKNISKFKIIQEEI